jgi:hypothetical protein
MLYQDEPSGSLLKFIMLIVLAVISIVSIYLWLAGKSSAGLAMLIETLFIGLIFWIVFPRSYQVYQNHLRIVLGGPFKVKIGFDQIKAIEATSRNALTINFATTITRTYVIIVKKQGLSIAITPSSNDIFVYNANQALSQWQETKRVDSADKTKLF